MSDAERSVALALAPLLATWPEEEMPPVRIRAYVMVLGDLEPELLQAAVAHCIATCRFFPKPAEIRQAAFDLRSRAEGAPDPMAGWGQVVDEIGRVGSYGMPCFSHQVVTDAVRLVGGWQRLCLSENMASDRARFVEAYKELQTRRESDARMLPAVRDLVLMLADGMGSNRRIAAHRRPCSVPADTAPRETETE